MTTKKELTIEEKKIKKIYKQVIHKKDGGTIIPIVCDGNISFYCMECKATWEVPDGYKVRMNYDFTTYEYQG